MPDVKMTLSQEQMKSIHDQYEQELGEGYIQMKLKEAIEKGGEMTLANFIDLYNIEAKVKELDFTMVKDLKGTDQFMLMVYWLMSFGQP